MSSALAAIALGALLLTGCATARSLQETVIGWFAAEPKPRALYSRVSGAELHHEADAASEVVGRLALHEGVLAYRVSGDFTYVRGEASKSSGWVKSAELIEQVPRARQPSPVPAQAAAPQPEVAPTAPVETEPAQPEPPAEPEEPAQPEPSHEKSVFDPY